MAEKSASPDLAVAAIARRQRGVASIGQLRSAGLSDDAVLGRVRTGRLHRLHQGVYAVGHTAPSFARECMAAVLACGSADRHLDDGSTRSILEHWGAALSHRSAAYLWGLSKPTEGPVDVSIPGDGGRRRRKGVRVHRSLTLLPASVTLCGGIPITTPARTIADLQRASTGKTRLISPGELRRAIRQAGVLGLPIGDDEMRDPTRSDLERDFLDLCRRFGLPMPEVNVRIGPHLVDFLWRERKLVVETDGYISHRGRAAFEDDRGRDLELRARGFQVFRLAEKQLDEEPRRVAEVVAAALRVGADAARSA